MTTERFVYKSAQHALIAAMDFGIRIQAQHPRRKEPFDVDAPWIAMHIYNSQRGMPTEGVTLFVNPDSWGELESRAGDFVLGKIKGAWCLSEGNADHLKEYPGQIIARNNLPFPWPERENHG